MRSPVSQISIHKLEVFCLVVELDSVSLAAERLNIAQPVVATHLGKVSKYVRNAMSDLCCLSFRIGRTPQARPPLLRSYTVSSSMRRGAPLRCDAGA